MNKYTFISHGQTFTRASKAAAKKAYINGFVIALCPCKLRPGTPWHPEMIVDRETRGCMADDTSAGNDFENIVNSISYYSLNSETGTYISYFIESDHDFIHFTFSDGSNPYLFMGPTSECMKELNKWKKNYCIQYNWRHNYTLTEKGARV